MAEVKKKLRYFHVYIHSGSMLKYVQIHVFTYQQLDFHTSSMVRSSRNEENELLGLPEEVTVVPSQNNIFMHKCRTRKLRKNGLSSFLKLSRTCSNVYSIFPCLKIHLG